MVQPCKSTNHANLSHRAHKVLMSEKLPQCRALIVEDEYEFHELVKQVFDQVTQRIRFVKD